MFYKLFNVILRMVIYLVSGLIPRNPKRVIFGSWFGESFNDNAKYLARYLSQQNRWEVIWCGKEHVREFVDLNIKFVKRGSLRANYYAATSKYAFFTQDYQDIVKYNIFYSAKTIQLWHGVPLKKLSYKIANGTKNPIIQAKQLILSKTYNKCDYFIASSLENASKILTAFSNNDISLEKIIMAGQPRNDLLFNCNINTKKEIKNKIIANYNIPRNYKIITYLPTFRDNTEHVFSFHQLDSDELQKLNNILEENGAVIVEKPHFVNVYSNKHDHKKTFKNIININDFAQIDTQELLLISDILITDYSSCYFDFLLLDRPIIHYAYDYDYYKEEDRGFYYPLEEVSGGSIIKNVASLIQEIDFTLRRPDAYRDRRNILKRRFMCFEKGFSCREISNKVLDANKAVCSN